MYCACSADRQCERLISHNQETINVFLEIQGEHRIGDTSTIRCTHIGKDVLGHSKQ